MNLDKIAQSMWWESFWAGFWMAAGGALFFAGWKWLDGLDGEAEHEELYEAEVVE